MSTGLAAGQGFLFGEDSKAHLDVLHERGGRGRRERQVQLRADHVPEVAHSLTVSLGPHNLGLGARAHLASEILELFSEAIEGDAIRAIEPRRDQLGPLSGSPL